MSFHALIKKAVNPTLVACSFFAVFIVFAVLTGRCLYADGSYYFLGVLKTGKFTAIINCRSFADYLFELPVVVSLSLGIHSIPGLSYLFGIGCFCAWPLAMVLCYRMAPRHFWLVMVACAAGYLNTAFVAVGEHIVAHAFFWPALFAILYVRPLTPFAGVTLLGSALLLVRSYESMLFLGPLLIALLLWRLVSEIFPRNIRAANSGTDAISGVAHNRTINPLVAAVPTAVLGGAVVILMVATYIAWAGVEHPNEINYNGFKHGPVTELRDPTWTLEMTVLWTVIMLSSLSSPVAKFLKSHVGLVLSIFIVLFWGAWPLLAPRELDPASQYECRFLELLVPLMLAPVAVILALKPEWLAAHMPDLTRLAAMMLVAQSLWQISATHQWQGYVSFWRRILPHVDGPVLLSSAGDFGKFEHQYFCWANPCLSLMVGPRHVRAMAMPDRPVGWMPFDPLNPNSLPDLTRYGVDYTEYVEALMRDKQTEPRP